MSDTGDMKDDTCVGISSGAWTLGGSQLIMFVNGAGGGWEFQGDMFRGIRIQAL